MLFSHANLFTPISVKHRIFSKVPKINLRDRLFVLSQAGSNLNEGDNRLARFRRLRELALDSVTVAQIVVDLNGVLVSVNERARTLFDMNIRDIGCPLQDLEISYRPLELRSLIEQCHAERRIIIVRNIERHSSDVEIQYLDVQVTPLYDESTVLLGVSIIFEDVTSLIRSKQEIQRAREELETAYEELQSTNEELETTNEELQSTIEELETTNEELQSTNEESETMNEVNATAISLLKRSQKALIGKPLLLFIAKAERQAFHERLTKLKRQKAERVKDWQISNLWC